MTFAAVCTDCGWSFEHEGRSQVADRLERHARKEQHHVEFSRRPVGAPA